MDKVKDLVAAEERLKTAQEQYDVARVEAQLSCEHGEVVEGEYHPGGRIIRAQPPFRVCTACGYAEDGWGCGYNLLSGKETSEIERNEAMKYVRGKVLSCAEQADVRARRKSLREVLEEC